MLNFLQINLITCFEKIGTQLNKKIDKAKKPFSCYHGQTTDDTIFLFPTTPAVRVSLINYIKPNKAICPYSISIKIMIEDQCISQ